MSFVPMRRVYLGLSDACARCVTHPIVSFCNASCLGSQALALSHPKTQLRDTASFTPYRKQNLTGATQSRKLSELAHEMLGMRIQSGEHSPLEDAVAALRLYKLRAAEWERDHKRRSATKAKRGTGGRGSIKKNIPIRKSLNSS